MVGSDQITNSDYLGSERSLEVLTDAIRLQVSSLNNLALKGILKLLLLGHPCLCFLLSNHLLTDHSKFSFCICQNMQLVSTLQVDPEYSLLFFNPRAKVR